MSDLCCSYSLTEKLVRQRLDTAMACNLFIVYSCCDSRKSRITQLVDRILKEFDHCYMAWVVEVRCRTTASTRVLGTAKKMRG